MEQHPDNDLARVKELLRHTGEFIAYFELAETKMMDWRAEIEQKAQQLQHYLSTVHNELTTITDLLTHTGITQFRSITEKALSQGEANLQLLEQKCDQITHNFQQQQEQLKGLTENCLDKIESRFLLTSQAIANQLSKYDVHQFHRIASESCDHVERVAQDAVNKSNKLLGLFQFKAGFFAIFLTFLTAFIIVLYLSDELPWEMHHQAMNERQAGKVLLQAWPNLTQEEKAKILNDNGLQHG
jgi:hypothetical protein